jgi:NNP family nitrate/nitrite transporter-like MFS transporter
MDEGRTESLIGIIALPYFPERPPDRLTWRCRTGDVPSGGTLTASIRRTCRIVHRSYCNMIEHESKRAGHWPSLVSAFLYFDASFMVWFLLGALGNALSDAFGLSPGQEGVMLALPILGGACLRPIAGLLADRIGARRTALAGLAITMLGLVLGWLWADSYPKLLLVGVLLGVAGASFAVALPLASRWYPAEQQGFVLGLVGVGNGGTAIATLLAPRLVPLVGWNGVFGLALIPLALVSLAFAAMARDSPAQPARKPLRESLRAFVRRDAYWYCGFYAVTFGGFVGITSFLSIFFRDQYGIDPIQAGMFASLCGLTGSLVRPIGGYLADRFGGISVLFLFYLGLGVLGLRLSYIPHFEVALVSLVLLMVLLGMGNGAIFQMVPQRFSDDLGAVTGLIGAVGGLGGFAIPILMGYSRQWIGRFGPGFFAIGLLGFIASGLLLQASREWQTRGVSAFGTAATRRDPDAMVRS